MFEDAERAELRLPDGSVLDYEIRTSEKARALRLKIGLRDGLVVVAPEGLDRRKLFLLVESRADWVVAKLKHLDSMQQFMTEASPALPQSFDLPALGESWRIEYQPNRRMTVGAFVDRPGRLVVRGAIEDTTNCHAALRRWLARHAKQSLVPWLENLSRHTGLSFSEVAIKNQRTRWGSCSARGCISLNCKLLFLSREVANYVLLHELCHTQEHNHGPRFWSLMHRYEKNVELLHGQVRDAWKLLPPWARLNGYGEI